MKQKELVELARQLKTGKKRDRRKAAKLLGSEAGKKGGPARALALTPERRKEIATKASHTRTRNMRKRKKLLEDYQKNMRRLRKEGITPPAPETLEG